MASPKEKICASCLKHHIYSTVLCQNCHLNKRKYGKSHPDHWYIECKLCCKKFHNKTAQALYCPECRKKHRLVTYKRENIKKPSGKTRRKNGQGCLTKAGYVHITKVGHPNASINGKIQEHTFVMSEFLGRSLEKHESVHHKNGIRNDNRIENLELWSTHQPCGQRVEDKVKWAKEILEKYKIFVN